MIHSLSVILGHTFLLSMLACGSSDSDESDKAAASSAWTNSAMQSVVAKNCANAGCHDGTSNPNFKTISETEMKAYTTALTRVNAGSMPLGSTLSSADLQTFQNFYK